jgi:hypothetical protein
MVHPMRLPTALAPLVLIACGEPISNAVFYEDAAFLAAIPSFENHGVAYPALPEDDTASLDTDLRQQSADVAGFVNASLGDLMALSDFLRVEEPSLREDDLRSWGPSSLGSGTRSLLLVDIIRSGEGQYDWAFMLSETSSGPWDDFFRGTHYAGATVAEGDGSFEADLGLLAAALDGEREGSLRMSYDHRDGTSLRLALDGYRALAKEPLLDARFGYDTYASGGADFQYSLESETLLEGPLRERAGVRSRWNAEGALRADSLLSGGELGDEEYSLSQCFDEAGVLVYQGDSHAVVEPIGAEWDCAWGRARYPDDW